LELPILGTICLLSSSFTIHDAVSALRKDNVRRCTLALTATVLLGAIFLTTTAREWYHLIHDVGLTIRTNLFGTTFYSLVGLHATHVAIGLIMLAIALTLTLAGRVTQAHAERLEVLSLYWHFVDGVWVVVFLVVYVLGR
jgi:cytochrome c oxidase subunit 3/cytochrome o ubiquinol oxidase subunit 3